MNYFAKDIKDIEFSNAIARAKHYLDTSIIAGTPIRVDRKVARYFLKNNSFSVINDVKYHYQIKDLGLGICEIMLAPPRLQTLVTKQFISF